MARTILVADDSPTIRKIVELTFSDSEIRVVAVENGSEALAQFDASRPDLALLDVVMPEPNGYEICRTIKGSPRPVPVMLLAGTFEPFDAELARHCGADDHLVKPFESRTLEEKVRELLQSASAGVPVPPAAAPEERGADAEQAAAPEPADPPRVEPTPALVDAVTRAVVERLSTDAVREVAWEVVPRLAREIIRERIRELEQEEDGGDRA